MKKYSIAICAPVQTFIVSDEKIEKGDHVFHENGRVGLVRNRDYSNSSEVDVQWFHNSKYLACSRTSLIYLKKIVGPAPCDIVQDTHIGLRKAGDPINLDIFRPKVKNIEKRELLFKRNI